MNKIDRWSVEWLLSKYPEMNRWTNERESGIDYSRMPDLRGSGLERYYRPQFAVPVSDDSPMTFWDTTLRVLCLPLFFVFSQAFEEWGKAVLEGIQARGQEHIPPIPWDEMTALLQTSTWEHR